ncbi:protein ENHANCED DISEASE RESISTANCE 4 [Lathyrus oleraceus]|uniref:Zinc-ribbon domain-containing protein n=1 Tax=Pisum sativum TaxID=3888 RepID=A0A9D4XN84_PEA|nr:protein ENHANCED DISEASE RESISTANCE 4-like [Pisum sativum]KAI5421975.1 hypothetical protein KIW84_045432 [Pisum sativum]
MEDSAKLRLVRCPKCQNVLHEQPSYSVYQCGGCGTVLRGKVNNGNGNGSLWEGSDEGQGGGVFGKSGNSFRKDVGFLSDSSDVDVKSNGGFSREDRRDPERSNKERERIVNRSVDGSEKGVLERGFDVNKGKDNEGGKTIRREQHEPDFQVGGSSFPRRMSNWPNEERVEMEGLRRNQSADMESVRFSTLNYPDEGTSRFSYNHGEQWSNYEEMDGMSRVRHLEQDRAELLRKLDELSKQLSNSSEMVNNPKEKGHDLRMVPPDPRSGSDIRYPDGPSGLNRTTPSQFFDPNKHVAAPPYYNHHHDPYGYSSGREMSMHNFHPSMHNPGYIPGYGDPFGSQMARGPHPLSRQFPQQPMHPYFPGRYADTGPDSYEQYAHNPIPHPLSCTCFHCYNIKRRGSMPAPPATFHNNRFPLTSNDPILYRNDIPGAVPQHAHNNSRTAIPAASSQEKLVHTRLVSGFDSERGGFAASRSQNVMPAIGSRRCHPIAGGSPFITCHNCFELLQLPKKVLVKVKSRKQKMRCGACSSEINISIINKKLVTSHVEMEENTARIEDASVEVVNSRVSYSHGHVNTNGVNFSSDDYSGYDFHSLDRGSPAVASDPSLNSRKLQEMQSFHSSSPSISDDENISEVMTAPNEATKSIQPSKAAESPPPAGSPLQEYLDYSTNNHAVNRFGKGNQSGRSEQEKVAKLEKNTSRQNSVKEVVLASEMDVIDYSNSGISQDYADTSREHDRARSSKGGDSFFANIFKKGSRASSLTDKSDDSEKCVVTVNGQPLSDRVVKKAEKIAGPIQPGNYWYDSRAGFWGVIGGPCLGIIPPFIEEFNYPIPDKCAGGNTDVFVNGRELHQKDLDLLSRRGLPNENDRSYIVEISGRVLDVDTGEELDGLGKLAPTVEKAKHGFGMKVPRSAAA